MQVGKQIQHYRKEKNLSQDDLAEIIFVSRQSISNWERGATYPDINTPMALPMSAIPEAPVMAITVSTAVRISSADIICGR